LRFELRLCRVLLVEQIARYTAGFVVRPDLGQPLEPWLMEMEIGAVKNFHGREG